MRYPMTTEDILMKSSLILPLFLLAASAWADGHPCADFSGTYRGVQAIGSSFQSPAELKVVQQGCESVYVGIRFEGMPDFSQDPPSLTKVVREEKEDAVRYTVANFDEDRIIITRTYDSKDGKSLYTWFETLRRNAAGKLVWDQEIHWAPGMGGSVRHRFTQD
jgi:hypothetical protein